MKEINLHDVFKDIESINEDGSSKCYTGFYLEQYDIDNKPELLAKLVTKTPKVKIDKDDKGIKLKLIFPTEEDEELAFFYQILEVWEQLRVQHLTNPDGNFYLLKIFLTTEEFINLNIQCFMPDSYHLACIYPRKEIDTLVLSFSNYKIACAEGIKVIDNGDYSSLSDNNPPQKDNNIKKFFI